MRVLITGLPLFSKRLAEDLQRFDPENEYLFYNTYYSKFDLLKFIWKLAKADLVISMNGVTDKSRTLDMVLRFKKKLVLQWMGSDSLYAMERFQNDTIDRRYVDYSRNFVDSPWLFQELTSIDVQPEVVKFKYFESKKMPVDRYDELKAVTYISQERQLFYGFEWVIALAEKFSDIQFVVYGASSPLKIAPKNILWKGWQPAEVFTEAIRQAPIFLRLTEHDGYSVSVIEALTFGTEVLSRMPVEHTTQVYDIPHTINQFEMVIQRLEKREMCPDFLIAERAKTTFNKTKVLSNYLSKVKEVIYSN